MDAASILGALLGNKSKASSGGGGGAGGLLGSALGSVLGGGKKTPAPQPKAQPTQSRTPSHHATGGVDDLLRNAYSKYQTRSGQCNDQNHAAPTRSSHHETSELDNEQAVTLVRAMVNASKADGQLDQNEQNRIVEQLGNVTQEEVEFLNTEFKAPLDVKAFTWSVPLGQEESVYAVSVMAINLDLQKEATYLKDLAHGLRLAPETCNNIHDRYNAPRIF